MKKDKRPVDLNKHLKKNKSAADNIESVNSRKPPVFELTNMLNEAPVQAKKEKQQKPIEQQESGNSGSQGLPENVQLKMEQSFGADFSSVSIQANSKDAENIGAKAFTQGESIHFANGNFNPHSQSGQELIGHELSHVVQQRENRVQAKEQIGSYSINRDANHENEADHHGKKAAAGQALGLNTTSSPVQNQVVQGWELPSLDDMVEAGKDAWNGTVKGGKKLVNRGIQFGEGVIEGGKDLVNRGIEFGEGVVEGGKDLVNRGVEFGEGVVDKGRDMYEGAKDEWNKMFPDYRRMSQKEINAPDTMSGELFHRDGKDVNFDVNTLADEFIDSHFKGGGGAQLRQAMTILYSNQTEGITIDQALQTVAKIRGIEFAAAKSQYQKAVGLRHKGRTNYWAKAKNARHLASGAATAAELDPSPDLDLGQHPTFTGSDAQLRFGKVVGDVFGLDPVFGSLMSPTGGLVGPGNSFAPLTDLDPNGPVALHGTLHDAFGYLKSCFDIGPGYDYLDNEKGEEADNPYAGQTNIKWWVDQFDQRGRDVSMADRFLGDNSHHLNPATDWWDENAPDLNNPTNDDDNVRETISTMSQDQINALQTQHLIGMFSTLMGGALSEADVIAIEKLCSSVSSGKREALKNYFEEQSYTILHLGYRLRIEAALGIYG